MRRVCQVPRGQAGASPRSDPLGEVTVKGSLQDKRDLARPFRETLGIFQELGRLELSSSLERKVQGSSVMRPRDFFSSSSQVNSPSLTVPCRRRKLQGSLVPFLLVPSACSLTPRVLTVRNRGALSLRRLAAHIGSWLRCIQIALC